jgi:hypothetical protein
MNDERVLAQEAPDAGGNVITGEPRVVMWVPEGKTADIAGEKYGLHHLGDSMAVEGRWGQCMFPQLAKLRNGMGVVRRDVGWL